jgi:hypothetical protein
MKMENLNLLVWRGKELQTTRAAIPTGFADLDRHLPGAGWPLGVIIEVFVDRYGIGELALFIPALVQLTKPRLGEPEKWVTWIAPPLIPYAPALQQRGVGVERLLMIHPTKSAKDCVWAIEQTLRSGLSAGVLAWITAVDGVVLRRLQLAAEEQGCWSLLFRPLDALPEPSPAALRLRLSRQHAGLRVQICKCRGGRTGSVHLTAAKLNAGSPCKVSPEAAG